MKAIWESKDFKMAQIKLGKGETFKYTLYSNVGCASGSASVAPKYVQVKNVTDLKIIKFDGQKLYLEEHKSDAALPASRGGLNCQPEELLSDYVNDFKVDIKGSNVTVSFAMKSGKKTYKIDETTKIRSSPQLPQINGRFIIHHFYF